ncbi:MAG: hypothetical protein ACREBN_12845 [Burkholderiaceae bacterium]
MFAVASDPQYDLSLRLLALLVSGALLASLITLLATAVQPFSWPDRGDVGPPAWAAMPFISELPFMLDREPERLAPPRATGVPATTIYRCQSATEITYSDRPCTRGNGRVLRLPQP